MNHAHDLVCIMSICHTEQLYTDAALVLKAAAAGKRPDRSALAMRLQPCRWVAGAHQPRAQHARSCEEAVLASLTWICDAEQLYTDTTLVLYRRIYTCSSGRRKLPHRSALALRRRPCRWVSGRLNVLMFGVARKLTLRASGGSRVDLIRREAMHRRSARARRIYTCSSSRKKRPHRSAL